MIFLQSKTNIDLNKVNDIAFTVKGVYEMISKLQDIKYKFTRL